MQYKKNYKIKYDEKGELIVCDKPDRKYISSGIILMGKSPIC